MTHGWRDRDSGCAGHTCDHSAPSSESLQRATLDGALLAQNGRIPYAGEMRGQRALNSRNSGLGY